jgi:hypothetical protein
MKREGMQIDESIENFLILKSIINDYGVEKKPLERHHSIPFKTYSKQKIILVR